MNEIEKLNAEIAMLREELKACRKALDDAADATEYCVGHPSMDWYLDVMHNADKALSATADSEAWLKEHDAEVEEKILTECYVANGGKSLLAFMSNRKQYRLAASKRTEGKE